ncbi:MAG: anti-sigma factor family protein [Bryobacteraceae bacterium]
MHLPSSPRPSECLELFERLSAYLDGELPVEERRRIEEHICGCPPCVEFLESLRRTVDLCLGLEPDAPPPPIPAELKKRLLAAYQKARESCKPQR